MDGTSAVAEPAVLWATEIISSGVMEKETNREAEKEKSRKVKKHVCAD